MSPSCRECGFRVGHAWGCPLFRSALMDILYDQAQAQRALDATRLQLREGDANREAEAARDRSLT